MSSTALWEEALSRALCHQEWFYELPEAAGALSRDTLLADAMNFSASPLPNKDFFADCEHNNFQVPPQGTMASRLHAGRLQLRKLSESNIDAAVEGQGGPADGSQNLLFVDRGVMTSPGFHL